MPQSADIGLIIPMREEFESAREVLDFGPALEEDGSFVHPFTVAGSSVSGVAAVLFGMGQARSAVAATHLLRSFDLRLVALVGIAGALSPHLTLGDVVIASSVDEYMYGARANPGLSGEGVEFQVGGISWQAGLDLVSYADNFRYLAGRGFESWQQQARQRRDAALAQWLPDLASEYPDYQVGAVATGEIVSAARSFAAWLRYHNRFRLAIEMEAGGVAQAVYRSGRADLIVIRGISDFADERKYELDATARKDLSAGAWRNYAAINAASLFASLVTNDLFPWPRAARAGGPLNSTGERPRPGSVTMQGWASGNGQVNQAARDLYIGDQRRLNE